MLQSHTKCWWTPVQVEEILAKKLRGPRGKNKLAGELVAEFDQKWQKMSWRKFLKELLFYSNFTQVYR